MLIEYRKYSFGLLIFLIVFSPIFFGGVHVWAYSVMEIAVLMILFLSLMEKVFAKNEIEWIKTPITKVITIFFIFLIIQTLPLPLGFIEQISPASREIFERFYQVLQGEAVGKFHALSLNPSKSWTQIFKLLTYVGIFFYIINHIHSRRQLNFIVISIIFVGLFEVLLSWVLMKAGSIRIGPFSFNSDGDRASGSYINPNHLAGYLEMVILLGMGFLLSFSEKKSRRRKGFEKVPWSKKFREWLFHENFSPYRPLLVLSIGILFIGLLLTGSRGGLLGLFVGIIVVSFFSVRSWGKKFAVLFLVLSLFVIMFVSLNTERKGIENKQISDHSFSRFGSFNSNRPKAYMAMLPIVRDFPISGSGLGTFEDIFIRYKPEDLRKHYTYAHNDWLELLIETGIIGFTLVFTAFILFFIQFIRMWRKCKDPFGFGMGLGVLGSSAAIMTHGLVDFNFQIPANAFLFSVILGVGFSSINNQHQQGNEIFTAPVNVVNLTSYLKIIILCLALLGIMFWGHRVILHFLSEKNCPTQKNSTLNLQQGISLAQIKKGLEFAPNNSGCLIELVKKYDGNKGLKPKKLFETYYTYKNIKILENAIRINPVSGNYYLLLGEEYLDLSNWKEEDVEENLKFAIKSFDNTKFFKLEGYKRKFELAYAWFEVSAKSPNDKKIFSDMAFDLLQKTLTLRPQPWKEAIEIALEYFPKEVVLRKVLPPPGTSTKFYPEKRFENIRKQAIRWLENK